MTGSKSSAWDASAKHFGVDLSCGNHVFCVGVASCENSRDVDDSSQKNGEGFHVGKKSKCVQMNVGVEKLGCFWALFAVLMVREEDPK